MPEIDDTPAPSAAVPASTPSEPVPARSQPDRFLIGIVVGLAVLLVASAVGVAFLRQPVPELPVDTPSGTVQRFYAALEQKDYASAYGYLSDSMVSKPTRAEFTNYNVGSNRFTGQERIRITDEKITGSDATVTAAFTTFYNGSGPFGGSGDYTTTEVFTLRREGAAWRITGLPYTYVPFPSR